MKNVNQTIVETFREVAEYLETGRSGRRPRLLLTGMGSEHGEENSMQAAVMAARVGLDVSYIGTLEGEGVTTVPVADEEAGHRKMVELLESGAADAAVTMHFPFPIGVSTVGRVVTPARGKSMFLATTTGTSSANRLEGMILNAIYGIITAKACGHPQRGWRTGLRDGAAPAAAGGLSHPLCRVRPGRRRRRDAGQ